MKVCNSIREYCGYVFDSYYSLGVIKVNDIIKDDLFRYACSDEFDDNKQALKMLCYYYGYGTERDDTKLLEQANKLAEKHNAFGLYFLGLIYNFGYCGFEVNRDIAYDYYYKAIEVGDIHSAKESICQLIMFGKENKHNIDVINTLYELCNHECDFAHHLLAICYKDGIFVEKNDDKFVHYINQAISLGSTLALNMVGEHFYEKGNYDTAITYFQKGADNGQAKSYNRLGYMYEKGYGTPKNLNKAFDCYQKAKDYGYIYANFRLGSYFFLNNEVKDYAKALEYYRVAADNNIAEAISMLGHYYYNGYNTVKVNYQLAYDYFSKSAELGYTIAIYMIGECYFYGRGVNKDYTKAFEYYLKAADNGYSSAIHAVGYAYYRGYGVEQNYNKAIEFFEKAAAQNNSSSVYLLGNCYYYGYGVNINYTKSFEYYAKAANLGHINGIYAVGHAYYTGKGTALDYNKAFYWLTKGADANNLDSIDLLGDCYYYGRGTTKNPTKAVQLYKKSAEKGCTRSYYSLGYSYYYGDGTTINKIEGIKYFIKATDDHNSKFALKRLANIILEGTGGYQSADIRSCIERALNKRIITDTEIIQLARKAIGR